MLYVWWLKTFIIFLGLFEPILFCIWEITNEICALYCVLKIGEIYKKKIGYFGEFLSIFINIEKINMIFFHAIQTQGIGGWG